MILIVAVYIYTMTWNSGKIGFRPGTSKESSLKGWGFLRRTKFCTYYKMRIRRTYPLTFLIHSLKFFRKIIAKSEIAF